MVTANELLAAAKDTALNDINAQGPDGLTLLARVAHFLHHTTADEDLATIKATLRLVLQKGGKVRTTPRSCLCHLTKQVQSIIRVDASAALGVPLYMSIISCS